MNQNDGASLSVAEIRFLDRIAGKATDFALPGYFEYEYHMDCQVTIRGLFNRGYLTFSSPAESVQLADMATLRELAKSKGLKTGGKKADIVQRILDNYTADELNVLNLPKRYALTDSGKAILKQNAALVLYHLMFGSRQWATSEEIIAAQNAHPDFSGEEILVMMLKDRIKKARKYSEKLPLYHCLLHFCHDEQSRNEMNRTIKAIASAADREFKQQQNRALKKSAATFGMTPEELSDLHEKTRRTLVEEARARDAAYDFSSDAEIMRRLEALDELSRSEFYRLMEKRKLTQRQDDPLSLKDYALLDLQAIERAANARGVSK